MAHPDDEALWFSSILDDVDIAADVNVREMYKRNYAELCDRLRPLVGSFQNVITHNPWGEYGHPDPD